MPEPCPTCKSTNVGIRYQLSDYRIARCSACRLEYHDGFGGGGEDEGMFSEAYYRVRHREAFEAQFDNYANDPSAAVFSQWMERLERLNPPGRILDVGCALGTFLKIAEARGWQPHGVEISHFAAEFATQTRGLQVFNGDLDAFPGEDDSFDVVTFWDSIEHVTHPLENLRTAVRLLKTGGHVLLTTDNFDCLVADAARLTYRATLGRSTYAMERVFIAPNRTFFSEETLRATIAAAGLHVVILEKMEYPLDKIRTNWAERLILKSFYGLGALLHRQAQVTVVARKP